MTDTTTDRRLNWLILAALGAIVLIVAITVTGMVLEQRPNETVLDERHPYCAEAQLAPSSVLLGHAIDHPTDAAAMSEAIDAKVSVPGDLADGQQAVKSVTDSIARGEVVTPEALNAALAATDAETAWVKDNCERIES